MYRPIELDQLVEKEKAQEERPGYIGSLENISPEHGGVDKAARLNQKIELLITKYEIRYEVMKKWVP